VARASADVALAARGVEVGVVDLELLHLLAAVLEDNGNGGAGTLDTDADTAGATTSTHSTDLSLTFLSSLKKLVSISWRETGRRRPVVPLVFDLN
jgi:hypothetical protein